MKGRDDDPNVASGDCIALQPPGFPSVDITTDKTLSFLSFSSSLYLLYSACYTWCHQFTEYLLQFDTPKRDSLQFFVLKRTRRKGGARILGSNGRAEKEALEFWVLMEAPKRRR